MSILAARGPSLLSLECFGCDHNAIAAEFHVFPSCALNYIATCQYYQLYVCCTKQTYTLHHPLSEKNQFDKFSDFDEKNVQTCKNDFT